MLHCGAALATCICLYVPVQSAREGWFPQHLLVRDEARALVGACPLYLKGHSYGEMRYMVRPHSTDARAGSSGQGRQQGGE